MKGTERINEIIATAERDASYVTATEVLSLCEEVVRLRKWVDDLQAGKFVTCVYCGHRYGPGETTPVTMADALKAHVAVCEHHPMSRLLQVARAADHAFLSLLAVRSGLTDEFIQDLQADIRGAVEFAEGKR